MMGPLGSGVLPCCTHSANVRPRKSLRRIPVNFQWPSHITKHCPKSSDVWTHVFLHSPHGTGAIVTPTLYACRLRQLRALSRMVRQVWGWEHTLNFSIYICFWECLAWTARNVLHMISEVRLSSAVFYGSDMNALLKKWNWNAILRGIFWLAVLR